VSRVVMDAVRRNACLGIKPEPFAGVGIRFKPWIAAARDVDGDFVPFVENEARRPEVDTHLYDVARLHEDFPVQALPIAQADRRV